MKESITISDHDNNTALTKLSYTTTTLCKRCLVCEDSIKLTEQESERIKYGLSIEPSICDKCKDAILRMRRFMEGD